MIEDAIVSYRDALREKLERDDEAWTQAHQALAEARREFSG